MRTTNTEYMFSKTEIRILRQLTKGKQSLSEIGKALSLKSARLSQNLKKLQEKGLIQKTGQGNRKIAYFNDTKHALLLRDLLLSFGHIDWENILTGKTIELLFQTLIPSENSPAKVSETTRWRQLKNLKTRGIITQEEKTLNINPRFCILNDFLNEYQKFIANKLSKAISENSVILWQKDMEFLIRAPKKKPIHHPRIFSKQPHPYFKSTTFHYSQILTSTTIQQAKTKSDLKTQYCTHSSLNLTTYGTQPTLCWRSKKLNKK